MSRIGRAIIEVLLRTEQAKAQIEGVKKDIQGIQNSAGVKGNLLDPSGKTQESIDKLKASTAGLGTAAQSSAGSFAMLAAVAGTAAFAIAEVLDSWLNRAADSRQRIDDLTEGIHSLREAFQSDMRLNLNPSAVNLQIDQVTQATKNAIVKMKKDAIKDEGALSGFKDFFVGWTGLVETALDRAMEVDKEAAELIKTQNQRIEQLRANSIKADEAATSKLNESRLDGVAKLYAEQERADKELETRKAAATTELERDAIEARKRATDEDFDRRREKIRIEEADRANEASERYEVEQAKKERREKEAAERVAKHAAEVWAREMERATRNLYEAMDRAAQANAAITNQSLSKVTTDVSRLAQLVDLRLRANGVDMRR